MLSYQKGTDSTIDWMVGPQFKDFQSFRFWSLDQQVIVDTQKLEELGPGKGAIQKGNKSSNDRMS